MTKNQKLTKPTSKHFYKARFMNQRKKHFPTRTVAFDVDGTLLLYPEDLDMIEEQFAFQPGIREFRFEPLNLIFNLIPHTQNINELKSYYNKGFEVIVWSAGSKEWAQAAVTQLGLNGYVDVVTTKPEVYVDDLDVTEWMGVRHFLTYKPGGEEE